MFAQNVLQAYNFNFPFQVKIDLKKKKLFTDRLLKLADDDRLLWYFPHVVVSIWVASCELFSG